MTGYRATAVILGHQGGWDEAALFVGPVLLALGAVWLVERRQRKRRSDDAALDAEEPDEPLAG